MEANQLRKRRCTSKTTMDPGRYRDAVYHFNGHIHKALFGTIQAASDPLLGETPVPLIETLSFVVVQNPDGNFVELIGPFD